MKIANRYCAAFALGACAFALAPICMASVSTYYVDCDEPGPTHIGSREAPFNSLELVNALQLLPGDTLLFKRGSTCHGELVPKGSGNETAPLHISAYGDGPLPRIVAREGAEAVLQLTDQQYLEIDRLDLSGSTTYGLLVESNKLALHHLVFRDLQVHDVRGKLAHKESGLVVIRPTSDHGSITGLTLDGIHAFNTTQWSGIFVAGAANVQIRHAVVHDVQGDGIVIFSSQQAVISQSVAWHTGMQHQQTIGTPNAIWTWHCTDCTVEDNEAFLSDSPGVDGGSFDIDFGNI